MRTAAKGMKNCTVIPVRVLAVREPLRALFSSLAAFVASGVRPQTPLARAIVLVLIIKLIGIAGIKLFMFPNSAQPAADAAAVARLLGPAAPAR
jgi:hypothetical protein